MDTDPTNSEAQARSGNEFLKSFRKPTPGHLIFTSVLLILYCFFWAAEDYIDKVIAESGPSVTIDAIGSDFIFYLVLVCLIPVPLLLVSWNYLLVKIFHFPRLTYSQALIIFVLVEVFLVGS